MPTLLPSIRAIATLGDLAAATNALACRANELAVELDLDITEACEHLDSAAVQLQGAEIPTLEQRSLWAHEHFAEMVEADRRAGLL